MDLSIKLWPCLGPGSEWASRLVLCSPPHPPEDTIIILEADVSTPSSAPFLLVI